MWQAFPVRAVDTKYLPSHAGAELDASYHELFSRPVFSIPFRLSLFFYLSMVVCCRRLFASFSVQCSCDCLQSLLPLGVWPSNSREDFDIPLEWKASTLKRYENPPPYRKLKVWLRQFLLHSLYLVDYSKYCFCFLFPNAEIRFCWLL